jgi:LPS-assembly protein
VRFLELAWYTSCPCIGALLVKIKYYTLTSLVFIGFLFLDEFGLSNASAAEETMEPVQACILTRDTPLTPATRIDFAHCLGWRSNPALPICHGSYWFPATPSATDSNVVQIHADSVSFYPAGRSELKGHVEVQQSQRIVSAQTANVYRDAKTHQVTQIELFGAVRYLEPGKLMWAKKAVIYPQDKSGKVEDVLYLFSTDRAGAVLPAWGRSGLVQRFANQDWLLRKATYTTCPPQDRAWQIEAGEITLDHAKETGVARNALLRVGEMPLLYAPYLSFPTSNRRKSGFLMPIGGYSNVGGFDVAFPYYWNMAPNYDATIVPHLYTERGLMMGGDFRFLTPHSAGIIGGNFLPQDRAFENFILTHREQFPALRHETDNRWSFLMHENSQITDNLHMNINYQQVSDNYYLQDFSSNLAFITENQLLRQGDLTYVTDHWILRGMLQSYQTLHPINQSLVADVYERLPQMLARGSYHDLPWHADFDVLGQFDYFNSVLPQIIQPVGPRYHLNPILALPQIKPWGYITPEAQVVENNYHLNYGRSFVPQSFNYTIPRYSVDSGLSFLRSGRFLGQAYTQTLEPRFYYLYVPYQNQSFVPAFDSAYMIFNTDQLFRTNRFSGFDRIGDTNQFSYALTSRWVSANTGQEKVNISIGQIRYFSKRKAQLCYNKDGHCTDDPLFLGFLSPNAQASPIASKAVYQMTPIWMLSSDYVWDVDTHATNNGDLNIHYQPAANQMLRVGYSYLVNGNIIALQNASIQDNALHQATFAYAWPLTDKWSSLGAYSYNLSKGYGMMSMLGFQYDSCCWAARLLGGHTFKSLTPNGYKPQYNNNVYLQVLLKGLGSVTNSDPASILQSYLPGYVNIFQR